MVIEGVDGLDGRECPVVVIGSGPVGLALATNLASHRVPVLMLESGGPGANEMIQQLSDADRIDPARHDDMLIAVARRLGGTSNLWGARCVPYDPIDFEARPGVDAHWPIDHAAVARYWPRAITATCSGEPIFAADDRLTPAADDGFSADPLERWANIQAAQNIHKAAIHGNALEVRTYATLVDLKFDEAGRITAIIVADSRSGARATLTPRFTVLAAGGIESTRLLLNAQRSSSERFGGRDGPLGRTYMGHVIGEIADIIFATPELAQAFDFYIDRHGSYVRRRFQPSASTQREHGLLNSAFWPVVPPVADARHGNAILSMVYLAMSYPALGRKLTAEAIRRRHVPDPIAPRGPHMRNVLTGMPAAASFGMRFLHSRYMRPERLPGFFVLNRANRYRLAYHGEHAPSRSSRIWLTDTTDRLGLQSVAIDLTFGGQDAESMVRTHDLLDRWLTGNGIGRLDFDVPPAEREEAILAQAAHGTHQIGLARMGRDRREGIVDGDLRTFDSPNLYVASTAVLPTSSQANPTLTAVALAIRLADHLAGELGVQIDVPAVEEQVA